MTSPPTADLPPAHTLAWVTVQELRKLGDSGKVAEINETAVELAGLTEQQQEVPHKVGSRTEVEYRLAWARTLCKLLGLVSNSERGVWTLTELGRTVDADKVDELKIARRKALAAARKAKKNVQQQAGAPQYVDDVTEDRRTRRRPCMATGPPRHPQENGTGSLRALGEETTSRSRLRERQGDRKNW